MRTLDVLHLATLDRLARSGRRPDVAVHDVCLRDAALALGFAPHPLAG